MKKQFIATIALTVSLGFGVGTVLADGLIAQVLYRKNVSLHGTAYWYFLILCWSRYRGDMLIPESPRVYIYDDKINGK